MRYTGKSQEDFAWQRNKALSMVTVDEICARLKDAVLVELSRLTAEAEQNGEQFMLDAPLSSADLTRIMADHLEGIRALEAGGDE